MPDLTWAQILVRCAQDGNGGPSDINDTAYYGLLFVHFVNLLLLTYRDLLW